MHEMSPAGGERSYDNVGQAVMGSIVKGPLCKRLGLEPSSVYHCAIMPCYDKKLEASREEFTTSGALSAAAAH